MQIKNNFKKKECSLKIIIIKILKSLKKYYVCCKYINVNNNIIVKIIAFIIK